MDIKVPVKLKSQEGFVIALLDIEEIYYPKKIRWRKLSWFMEQLILSIRSVFYLLKEAGDIYVSGRLTKVSMPKRYDFNELRKTPKELKQYFYDKKYSKIVVFQTRKHMIKHIKK